MIRSGEHALFLAHLVVGAAEAWRREWYEDSAERFRFQMRAAFAVSRPSSHVGIISGLTS